MRCWACFKLIVEGSRKHILSKDVRTHIWCPKASSQFCNSLCLYLLTRSGSTVSNVPSKSTICLRSQFGLTFWCEQYSVNLSPRRLIRNDYQWFTLRFTQTWAHMNWVSLIFPHQWPKFRGSRMVKFGLKHVPKWQNSVFPEVFKNGAYLSDLRLFGKSMYQINFQLIYNN